MFFCLSAFLPATPNSQFGTQYTNPPSTGPSSIPQPGSESQSRTSTFSETVRHSGDYMPQPPYIMARATPPVVVEVSKDFFSGNTKECCNYPKVPAEEIR